MVDVAQLVEPRIVIPAVAGSSPVVHPNLEFTPGARRRHTEVRILGVHSKPEIYRRNEYTAPVK